MKVSNKKRSELKKEEVQINIPVEEKILEISNGDFRSPSLYDKEVYIPLLVWLFVLVLFFV